MNIVVCAMCMFIGFLLGLWVGTSMGREDCD